MVSCREDKNGEKIYEVADTTISVIPLTGELDSKIVEEATQAKSSGGKSLQIQVGQFFDCKAILHRPLFSRQ